VLVAGGSSDDETWSSAEIFDPTAGYWISTGAMATAREGHTATLLADGRVLVAGGLARGEALAPVEIYEPLTERWNAGSPMRFPRYLHTATALANGKAVVVVGGWDGTNAIGHVSLYRLLTDATDDQAGDGRPGSAWPPTARPPARR
jgi:hypothetical protein